MITHVISKLTAQNQPIEAKPLAEWRHGHGVMYDLSDGEFIQVILGPSGVMVHDGQDNHLCIPLAEIVAYAQCVNPKFKPNPDFKKAGLVRIKPPEQPKQA